MSLKDLCALKKQTLLTYGRCKLGRVVAAHCLSLSSLQTMRPLVSYKNPTVKKVTTC